MKKYTSFQLDKRVKDLEGKECLIADGDTAYPFSVRMAFRKALNAVYATDQPTQTSAGISFEDKMKRYRIAEKIWNAELSVELSTEEQSELKKCVGKLFNGEALGFLEGVLESRNPDVAINTVQQTNGQLTYSKTPKRAK